MEMMEDEELLYGEDEMLCSSSKGKKRRLGAEQVRALERSFELENKLEPERKVKLAEELGLQPRQVAVWFQNRRARWKTKRLERDFSALKTEYQSLLQKHELLARDKDSLLTEIKELKAKLGEGDETATSFTSVKEESKASDEPPPLIYKDGSSDSDSSAILTDSGTLAKANFAANSPSFLNYDSRTCNNGEYKRNGFNGQKFLKMENCDDFLCDDEICVSFFSDEQAPSLSWCYEGDNWT
ncbi:hypothetical protein LUZ60_001215 [Juncus effusus]|nr:hypothetical protein LUZ60_001215 [Juncus effusus]